MKYDLNKKTNRFAERTLAAFSESLMQLLETKALESITGQRAVRNLQLSTGDFL